MKTACLKIISWLEKSGKMPEEAVYDIECAKENIEDSLRDFLKGVGQLLDSDYDDPIVFRNRVRMMNGCAQDLRNDIQDIEDALCKTLVHRPAL